MISSALIAGIDLGGTKIETRVFDDNLAEVARNRIATPTESYAALLDGLVTQVAWIEAQGNVSAIGLGTPGLINPATGVMLTANLPATGQTLGADITVKVGRAIAILKDSRAFTLSEAAHGAGLGARNVVGLVIGTGVSCGQVIDGAILPDLNGQAGEFGHTPLPHVWLEKHNVPTMPCGCGLHGCYETYLAGPGLARLNAQLTGEPLSVDTLHPVVHAAWIELAACLVAQVVLSLDPDVIVLGGGLGMRAGLPSAISAELEGLLLTNTRAPLIVQAMHGDASGALGAALYAQQQAAT